MIEIANTSKFTETYGFAGSQGVLVLEGQRLIPDDARNASTLFLCMHPTSALYNLPIPKALAKSGLHVLCASSRYPRNDSALIMEKVVLDVGHWIDWARTDGGYDKVVLVGWSGGGSLALFYQAQAERPSVSATPAGDPVDLAGAELSPADAIIFIAAHLSRAETLTEWLDPSVLDETNPEVRDLELDIYSPDCPHQPPFDQEFVEQFRAAQQQRSLRITTWAEDLLHSLSHAGGVEHERGFVVHRTMCDPRWIDPQLDPNDRQPNWCYLGDPRTVNVGPAGLARFTSLRSWLSQWSYHRSNAKGPANAALIQNTPVLQIENSADDAVPATHNSTILNALATTDKDHHVIADATHYYLGQPDKLQDCINLIHTWTGQRQL